ncbi:MAG: YiiD C-terminal domain-containing protein [Gammaproteobacteria bacterium]
MSPIELQQYLHDHIPLSKAMQVSAVAVSAEAVALSAPLGPNINHRDTVFGGSASALAILAAWSLLHVRLARQGVPCRLVIQRNSMEYLAPVFGEFTATSSLHDPQSWGRQLHMLERKGVARFSVDSELLAAGAAAGRFAGEFVAMAVNAA